MVIKILLAVPLLVAIFVSIQFVSKPYIFVSCALLSFLAFLLVPWGVFTISTGEIGVIRKWGEVKEIVSPGIHNRFWISNSLERYDIKTREIKGVFEAYSKDAQTVTGNLAVQYQIMPDKVFDITQQYGSLKVLEQKIGAIITERAKSVFSDKGAMEIVETRSSLSGEIEQRIIPMMEQYYVVITMVALENINFNEAFETAVEQKMIAEQEQLRSVYDRERAIIKADEQLQVAEREAQAVVQRARGDADALIIMQSAWGSLASEVRQAMLRQMFYEKWNGKLPDVMAGDSIDLIIDSSTGQSQVIGDSAP